MPLVNQEAWSVSKNGFFVILKFRNKKKSDSHRSLSGIKNSWKYEKDTVNITVCA